MRRIIILGLLATVMPLLCSFKFFWESDPEPEKTEITALQLDGQFLKGNLVFELNVKANAGNDKEQIKLVSGDVVLLEDTLGEKGELIQKNKEILVSFDKKAEVDFTLKFAVKNVKVNDVFKGSFRIPDFKIRPVTFVSDSEDTEINFGSILKVEKKKLKEGGISYHGFMTLGEEFAMSWKPKEKKLEKELSLICQVHSVANIGVGSLKLSNFLNYKIVQGTTDQLLIQVPDDMSVTRVACKNIRDWQIIKNDGESVIEVNLKSKIGGSVQLMIEGESAVTEFPSKTAVSLPVPLNVIRASGFLAVGTDSAVKLLIEKTDGVTQVESHSFQNSMRKQFSTFPVRSAFVYNFASLPVKIELSADKIKPVIHADNQITFAIKETELQMRSRLEIEVRDSTVREIEIPISSNLNVSDVRASDLNGFEVLKEENGQLLKVYFKNAFTGKKMIDISLEWSHKGWQGGEALPYIKVKDARTYRGFVSVSVEEGILVDLENVSSLRKIPVASLPVRGSKVVSAWRFKDADWAATLNVRKKKTAVYSELFHLYSLGENVIYGSISLTYHVSGAPVDTFSYKIPDYCKNLEIIALHRPRIYKEDDVTNIKIQKKISGNYNVLLTFEIAADTVKGEFTAGGIETVGTDSESGFISVTGSDGLKLSNSEIQEGVIGIDPDQIPPAYRLLQSHPVHLSYKYVKAPHSIKVGVEAFKRVDLLNQVIEHSTFNTKVSVNGERITEVVCWLKNSNHQHFKLKLPEKCDLWKTKVDDKTVRSTTQDGYLQIPVPINSDPNKTIKVEFTYAEKGDALKEGLNIKVESPSFSSPSIYNEWKLNMPGGFSVSKNDGSMKLLREKSLNERADIISLISYFLNTSIRSYPQFIVLFLVGLLIFAISWALPQTRVFGTVCGTILVLWSSVSLLVNVHKPVVASSLPSYEVLDFKKTVSAAEEVHVISGLVHDNSVIHSGQSEVGIIILAVAVLLFVAAVWLRNPIVSFLALVLAWIGCRGNFEAEYFFSIFLTFLIPVSMAVLLSRYLYNKQFKAFQKSKVAATTTLLLCAFLIPQARAEKEIKVPPKVTHVNCLAYSIQAQEKVASVTSEMGITAEKDETFDLLKSPCALKKAEYDKELFELIINNGVCSLRALKKGTSQVKIIFEVPVYQKKELKYLSFYKPNANKNKTHFVSGLENQEISSSAIFLSHYDDKGKSSAVGVFQNNEQVNFVWKAAEKKVSDIKPVYFSETRSLAIASEGHVDVQHFLDLQIAKGELNRLLVKIPNGQNVTFVNADGIVNWAFDPKTKMIEVIMKNPGKDKITVLVSTQIPAAKLPYKSSIEIPAVEGASRQHGLLAVAGGEGVKVSITSKKDWQGIDPVDFKLNEFYLAGKKGQESILFPFKYFKLPVKMEFNTEKVLPEIEVEDNSNFSIGDERYVLNSRLNVQIKKAGVFEVKLLMPEGYDMETLSVKGISHWDDIEDAQGNRFAILYFKNRVKGNINVNAVLIKNAEKKSGELIIPKLSVHEEKKHRGELIISAELGNRLEVKEKNAVGGMSLVNNGVMTFSVLRKDWSLVLNREVLDPRIEVEFLQSVQVTDNRYNVSIRSKVKIENAGTKFLILNAPADVQNLEIRGRDIAKTEKLADNQWRVEFKRKLIGEHELNLQYQSFYDPSKSLNLSGIKFESAARQRGYLCVFIPAYMTGQTGELGDSLKNFESRLLPTDISSARDRQAVYCYRVLKDEWQYDLQFVKHSKAEVLEATVSNVQIHTMVSRDGRQLHVVSVNISGGTKNFLNLKLPEGSSLSSVFVDREPLQTTMKDGVYLIPLNQSVPGEKERKLEITYIQNTKNFDWKKAALEGPQFDLPLKDINWFVYVPNEHKYDKFAGSMKYLPDYVRFDNSTQTYLAQNKEGVELTRNKANALLQQGFEYSSRGRRDLARKTFESVLNLSESMEDINEDARVQLQETLRQQTLVGLVNRRENLKSSISGESGDFDERKYNQGYFSDNFAKAVEKQLEEEDSQILGKMSDKIMTQQKAAIHKVLPLKVIIPQEGRRLHFFREVQIEPLTPMNVSFSTKEEAEIKPAVSSKTSRNAFLLGMMALASVFIFGLNIKLKNKK